MSKKQKINQVQPYITEEDAKFVYSYLKSGGWVTEHNVTKKFENEIKDFVKRKYAVAVPNGTIAIYLALISAGLKKGDRIAVPNITMIATINAIIWAGCTPILVDVGQELTMSFEKLINIPNLSAVIYVPLNGRTANGLEIEKWTKNNNILLIEDSAHALGSQYPNGKHCGSLGDFSILSFTPHKIITTGQGGMVLTNSLKYEKALIKIKTFNRRKDKLDWHEGFGLNFKITDMQSALGLSQFSTLKQRIERKKNIHELYKKLFSTTFQLGQFANYEVPWFIDLFSKTKKDLFRIKNLLSENNIETRVSYPALSKQKYLNQSLRTNLDFSEKIYEKILWLPSSVDLKNSSIDKIRTIINDYETK